MTTLSHTKLEYWHSEEMPQLQFPADWRIRIWPSVNRAVCRFQVNGKISVYFDAYDQLGCVGEPYWELYPNQDGDTERYLMHETNELIAGIARALAPISAV